MDGEVLRGMNRKFLVFILCLTALSTAAISADRPAVGLLPLRGLPGSYTHVIPELVYWQMGRIAGLGIVDMGSMLDCVQLDGLSVPAGIRDTKRYSQLAVDTGVNFLVTGAVEHVTKSGVRFRLIICSASDPLLRREQAYDARLSDLPATAARAAKWIASELGVPVASDIRFGTAGVPSGALRMMDRSLRLGTDCEVDQSVMSKSFLLACRAQTLCSTNEMISRWARSVSERQRGMGRYLRYRRGPQTASSGREDRDFSPPLYSVAADGKLVWQLSGAWRTDLEKTRGRRLGPQKLKSFLGALIARHPRSAYIRCSVARALAFAGEGPAMIREYDAALRLNPDSFRLTMILTSACINWHKNDKAQAVLASALRNWPNRSECHLRAADIYRTQKRFDKAAEEMETVVELDSNDGNRRMLADDYLRAGKVVESIREMATADDGIRRSIITFALVLSGVFLLGVLGMAALVKILLRT